MNILIKLQNWKSWDKNSSSFSLIIKITLAWNLFNIVKLLTVSNNNILWLTIVTIRKTFTLIQKLLKIAYPLKMIATSNGWTRNQNNLLNKCLAKTKNSQKWQGISIKKKQVSIFSKNLIKLFLLMTSKVHRQFLYLQLVLCP